MKKVFLLFAILLLITGCGLKTDSVSQKPVAQKTDTETRKPEPVTPKQGMQNIDPSKFENLVAEYKSAIIKTSLGDIKVDFFGADSPKTVNNFLNLAKIGFYDGTRFHRVISDFMIQGGDPNSKSDDWSIHGMGGPSYKFADEFNSHKLVRGSLAMANSGPNTNGSQFFVVTSTETPWLDGRHTNFGQVVGGMDVVTKIEGVSKNQNDHPLEDITVTGIELIK